MTLADIEHFADSTGRRGAEHGELRWNAVVVNGEGRPVATCDVLTRAATTWPPAGPKEIKTR